MSDIDLNLLMRMSGGTQKQLNEALWCHHTIENIIDRSVWHTGLSIHQCRTLGSLSLQFSNWWKSLGIHRYRVRDSAGAFVGDIFHTPRLGSRTVLLWDPSNQSSTKRALVVAVSHYELAYHMSQALRTFREGCDLGSNESQKIAHETAYQIIFPGLSTAGQSLVMAERLFNLYEAEFVPPEQRKSDTDPYQRTLRGLEISDRMIKAYNKEYADHMGLLGQDSSSADDS